MNPTRMEKEGPTGITTTTTRADPGTTTEGTTMKMAKAKDAQGKLFMFYLIKIISISCFWLQKKYMQSSILFMNKVFFARYQNFNMS